MGVSDASSEMLAVRVWDGMGDSTVLLVHVVDHRGRSLPAG